MQSTFCHGPMMCRRCWASDGDTQQIGKFKLVHDPGHWGASEPATLVLGISKGNTQSRAYAVGPFEQVAFKGIRHRILEIFQSVGLLPNEVASQFETRFTSVNQILPSPAWCAVRSPEWIEKRVFTQRTVLTSFQHSARTPKAIYLLLIA